MTQLMWLLLSPLNSTLVSDISTAGKYNIVASETNISSDNHDELCYNSQNNTKYPGWRSSLSGLLFTAENTPNSCKAHHPLPPTLITSMKNRTTKTPSWPAGLLIPKECIINCDFNYFLSCPYVWSKYGHTQISTLAEYSLVQILSKSKCICT